MGLESPPGVQALLDGLPMFAIRFSRTLSKWQLCLRIISALTALSVKPMVSSWCSLSLSRALSRALSLSLSLSHGTGDKLSGVDREPHTVRDELCLGLYLFARTVPRLSLGDSQATVPKHLGPLGSLGHGPFFSLHRGRGIVS